MGRVGWVSAGEVTSGVDTATGAANGATHGPATGTGDGTSGFDPQQPWFRLSVFDDGWVDLPGFGRSLVDVRRNLRVTLLLLALLVGGLLAVNLLLRLWVDLLGWSPGAAGVIGLVATFGVLGTVWWTLQRMRSRDRAQRGGDLDELRHLRDQKLAPKGVPGASMWRRTSSAEELAGALTNVRLTRASDVVDVISARDGDDHVVTVRLSSGEVRTYRSADDKLPELLGRFRPGGSAA